MRRHLGAALRVCTVAVVALAGWGCGESVQQAAAGGEEAARAAEWRWLQQTKKLLDAERDRLAAERRASQAVAAAQQQAAGAGAAAAPGTAAGQPTAATAAPAPAAPPQAAASQLAARERQVAALSEELNRRLVELINADPPIAGEPLSERQLQAIRMRSDEDIRTAREYIEEGGDYLRAFEILRSALIVDPGNPRLREELERARSRRYMTRPRFDQVKEGMTAAEVRGLLGSPNPKDVRAYPDKGVVAWFYPKDPAGSAAAVWFERRPDGGHTVYEADFEAVAAPAAGARPAEPAARSAA
jgi:hypothetical protein